MSNKDDLLNLETKKNIKKPLIYGAIAFLVFIIGVLGFAIYNNTAEKKDNVVLPPQIEETKQDTMFKEVPIEQNLQKTNKVEPEKKPKENLADKLIENENKQETITKNIKTNKEEPQLKQEPKKEDIKKPLRETKTQKAPKQKAIKSNYYIQVAALMKYKKPNKKFLALIKKEGYNYKLYETYYVKNGKKIEVIKILIGPFNKKDIRKELKKVKEKITQNAFIFRIK